MSKQFFNPTTSTALCCLLTTVIFFGACKKKEVSTNNSMEGEVTFRQEPLPPLIQLDAAKHYGELSYYEGNFSYGFPSARFPTTFTSNLVPAGVVRFNKYSLPFQSDNTYRHNYNSLMTRNNTGELIWDVEGGNNVPAFSYTTPEKSFVISSPQFPRGVKQGCAFSFTVDVLGGQYAQVMIRHTNGFSRRNLHVGRNIVAVSELESATLPDGSCMIDIDLYSQFEVPVGAKKFLVKRQYHHYGGFVLEQVVVKPWGFR